MFDGIGRVQTCSGSVPPIPRACPRCLPGLTDRALLPKVRPSQAVPGCGSSLRSSGSRRGGGPACAAGSAAAAPLPGGWRGCLKRGGENHGRLRDLWYMLPIPTNRCWETRGSQLLLFWRKAETQFSGAQGNLGGTEPGSTGSRVVSVFAWKPCFVALGVTRRFVQKRRAYVCVTQPFDALERLTN